MGERRSERVCTMCVFTGIYAINLNQTTFCTTKKCPQISTRATTMRPTSSLMSPCARVSVCVGLCAYNDFDEWAYLKGSNERKNYEFQKGTHATTAFSIRIRLLDKLDAVVCWMNEMTLMLLNASHTIKSPSSWYHISFQCASLFISFFFSFSALLQKSRAPNCTPYFWMNRIRNSHGISIGRTKKCYSMLTVHLSTPTIANGFRLASRNAVNWQHRIFVSSYAIQLMTRKVLLL